MFKHKKIQELNDFFTELNNRKNEEVYFYRINGYTDEVEQFIEKYYEYARLTGVVIEEKIPNPNQNNLSYYNEIMGMDFNLNLEFILASLKKWIPRMNDYQRKNVATSMYNSLNLMREHGKNDSTLKNAYIKFMCWLYYRFERIINQLGYNKIPKILYEGEISNYELILISILSNAGCDVVLLQYNGDENYLKLDPCSVLSDNLVLHDMLEFPCNFNLKWIRDKMQSTIKNNNSLYNKKPEIINCTNAWIKGVGLDDIKKDIKTRGNDSKFFYNCFCRINGVEDKNTYMNDLYKFYLELKNNNRKLVIINDKIPEATVEEIALVNRKNYNSKQQLLLDISNNIKYTSNIELQHLMKKAFLDVMSNEIQNSDININKLTSKAVYMVCWLRRYQSQLFSNWKMPDISCFIHMGNCKNNNEALFLKILSRLPIDVLILNPNLDTKCCLMDKLLYEINNNDTLIVNKFPQGNSDIHLGTAAYHAERELDVLMYQNSGMYRNYQYSRANTITLKTTYEEIKILWNQEIKYRPNFSIVDDVVNVPVIFAKVCGVKDSLIPQYWTSIQELITEDTFVIKNAPFIGNDRVNSIKAYSTIFLKKGKVLKEKIKSHSSYKYNFLREDIQDYIIDKLQLIIDQKLIKGTFENGVEYTIISVILNLPKEILRMIQKFDFTKKNPKLIYINTGEEVISLEDSILIAFLNVIGFDIVFFVPTGYQNVEKYFNKKLIEEYEVGEYVYDLKVPDLKGTFMNVRSTWYEKIFRKGR